VVPVRLQATADRASAGRLVSVAHQATGSRATAGRLEPVAHQTIDEPIAAGRLEPVTHQPVLLGWYAPSMTASPASLRGRLLVADVVAGALVDGGPVVALESTLISHGLPYPRSLEVALASEAAVRDAGATPATIAIRDGRILVGLDQVQLEALAGAPGGSVLKAARPTLAHALAMDGWATTTVSATMIAAAAAGIRVFATGGIGGVHRGAVRGPTPTLDISADLQELARTPVAVVCAGPKAILDLPLTLEYLETNGVPVIVLGQDEMPGFYSQGSGVAAPATVADVSAAADVVTVHLGLGLGSGILVCVPVPAVDALPLAESRSAVEQAIDEADRAAIHGPALTPWLLARVAELTAGRSLRANAALIVNNASVAARMALAMASRDEG
jgi:pseudouridylate synthase